MIVAQASINSELSFIGQQIKVFFTVILSNSSLNVATVNNISILYGKANILSENIFIPVNNLPVALAINATFNSINYIDILYLKALDIDSKPNNFNRLIQYTPKGIFSSSAPIFNANMKSIGKMLDNYYDQYFFGKEQVYSNDYTPELEFEYNDTVGLLSNSIYLVELFHLLSTLNIVKLNSYDLELFITKYIFYRLGLSCAVYLNDHVSSPNEFWILGLAGNTELDSTAILAPDSFSGVIENLNWTIYNAGGFSDEFEQEITNLIIRISRADIGNTIDFSSIIDPVDDDFELIGYTYKNDPRMIYNKCLQYLGNDLYPLNIIGYEKIILI